MSWHSISAMGQTNKSAAKVPPSLVTTTQNTSVTKSSPSKLKLFLLPGFVQNICSEIIFFFLDKFQTPVPSLSDLPADFLQHPPDYLLQGLREGVALFTYKVSKLTWRSNSHCTTQRQNGAATALDDFRGSIRKVKLFSLSLVLQTGRCPSEGEQRKAVIISTLSAFCFEASLATI